MFNDHRGQNLSRHYLAIESGRRHRLQTMN
jgi:hypothetical protein